MTNTEIVNEEYNLQLKLAKTVKIICEEVVSQKFSENYEFNIDKWQFENSFYKLTKASIIF